VTWRNGAVATLYNATEPDQLRGPQHDLAWGDEIAKWRYAQDAFDQLMFGLRLGLKPRALFTTTPRPIPIVRDLMKREGQDVVVTRGGTYDNRSNLAASFLKVMRDKYEGTRLGRQELFAEILDDVPGALWTRAMLDEHRVKPDKVPPLKRIVVAVDPAVTSDETSDEPGENGISVAGLGENNHAYVLDDASLIGSPRAWASRAVGMLDQHDADCIVVEINQGGDMVTSTLRSVRSTVRIKEVRASRGKHVRAEPVAALYEQGRVHHVGAFAALEDQMVLMTPQGYLGTTSPDRLDALVWGLTDLFPAMIRPVRKEEPRPVSRSGVSWMAS
jgi:phage terminase large subunit-like protein